MKTSALLVAATILLSSCAKPILYEHRAAMFADSAYQQYGIPQKYILGVDDNDAKDVDVPEIKFGNTYSWSRMVAMPSTETAGFPAGHTYYKYIWPGLNSNVVKVTYSYRCEYEGYTLFGWRTLDVEKGPLTIEKPIWLSWKELSGTQWNPAYNDNLTSNAIIANDGCFSMADINNTKTIESQFKIKNDAAGMMYINHQLTKIIDRSTGTETVNDDRFEVELLDTYNNNLITLGQNQEVNFGLKYIVTIAGAGNIQDNVKIRFFFGDSNTNFNRMFDIGADLRFVRQSSCP